MKNLVLAVALALSFSSFACKKASTDAPVGKRYAVRVEAGATPTIRVTPSSGWKMNLEYDHRFEGKVAASGKAVNVTKAQSKVSEAEVAIPVALAQGEACEGSVFFAICADTRCIPVEEKLSLRASK